MQRTLLVIAFSLMPLISASAQQVFEARSAASFPSAAAKSRLAQSASNIDRNVFLFKTTLVFPQLAVGPEWQTAFTIINMNSAAADFTLRFFADDGSPMTVTYTTGKVAAAASGASVTATLQAVGSTTITVYPDGQPLRTGYAILVPPSEELRFGGQAVFRQTVPGRPVFEAVVPLSDYDDWTFMIPFDNSSGLDTGLALVNTSTVQATSVYFAFLDQAGALIYETTMPLKAGEHMSFSLPVKFPQSAGKTGTLYVEGTGDFLSALGLRFNISGGGAFTSVPVMNWEGMF
jgi:hypothetical protein